jgi:hypothetical protein
MAALAQPFLFGEQHLRRVANIGSVIRTPFQKGLIMNHCKYGPVRSVLTDIPQPKIILEGTHLTRKTDVAFALAELPEIIGERLHRWHIPLVSAEWETRSDKQPTKAEPGRSMIDFLPGDEDWVNECYHVYVRLFELHRDYYWIVDRFHISTIAHQWLVHGRTMDLSWVDQRLDRLGFVLVHLHRKPNTFANARAQRLTYSETPARYDNLGSFVEEQEVMADLIARSPLQSIRIDVSDDDVPRIAAEIIAWVKQIGAFWRTTNSSEEPRPQQQAADEEIVADTKC